MRNVTPLVLTIFLAIMAIFLSVRGKTPASESGPAPTSKTAAEVTQAAKPEASEPIQSTLWASIESDIPPDPEAIFGTLDNGFRYMILPNEEPPNRLSVRLHIAAGSLMEADDQQGLAHFLEHMVFNGTERFKDANALIREMQGRGIAFGAHVNAYTSFDETVYMLDLPDVKPDTLGLTFGIMRDFADGALLSEEEIESERGVILAEKASRDSVEYRMMQQQFDALLPGSLIAQRFPIGEEEVIASAPRERFVDFYERYYVPSKMTFIVVGNVDTAAMVERIKETFGTMKNPENPGEAPELGSVTIPEGIEAHTFTDPELSTTEVSLTLVRPYESQPDTVAFRTSQLPVELANFIMGRRFERLSRQENAVITAGTASKFVLFNDLELGSISVTAGDDRWQESVPVLEQEFRRALEHGFTESELTAAKANVLNAYQEAVKRKETRRSETIATDVARSINDGTVYSTPEMDLKIVSEALEALDVSAVHQEFVKFWDAPGHHLVLSTKDAPADAAETLTTLYKKSTGEAVEPPAARSAMQFGYTEFGEAGKVANTIEVEDLGITQITLDNNVRINLKPTPFESNRIRMLARIGSGQLSQPDDMPLLDTLASSLFNAGGLGKHSNDDLSEILAGRNVSATLSITPDAFVLSGATTPEDQLLQLQLMVASITDPGYRPEALWQFQKSIPVLYQNLKHTTAGPLREMEAWLHTDDTRYTTPSQTKLSSYTIPDVQKWLTPELAKGYLELTVVGDFDKEKLLTDILATFGTLPERKLNPEEETLRSRSIDFPQPPSEKTFTYESKIPQAIATAIWKTNGIRGNIPEFRRLNILSEIFGDRIREEIREKLGAAYSPNAGASGEDALENFGYLLGQTAGKPENIPLLLSTMENIAAELAEKGATQEELDRALAPTLSQLERTLRDNSYWLSTVLSQSQAEPHRLDLARSRDEDYRSITLEEINALAKKYFPADNLHKIGILPKE